MTFDGLFLNQPNKATKCIEEKVDVMIDDSFKHVNLIAQSGIKCLYFRELPSLPANNENITEVYSWGEAYRKILALEKSIEKK